MNQLGTRGGVDAAGRVGATIATTLAIFLTCLCGAASADPSYSVSGTVSTLASGQPIADVTVTVIDSTTEAVVATAVTDLAGHYTAAVPAGTYRFRAVPANTLIFREATTAPRQIDSDSTVDIALVRAGIGQLHGTITDQLGNPISDLDVNIGNEFSSDYFRTGSNGEYSLEVPDGTYYFSVSKNSGRTEELPSYMSLSASGLVVDGDVTKNFVIRTYDFRVHVLDGDGNPVETAVASTSASDAFAVSGGLNFQGTFSDTAVTGSDGIAHVNVFATGAQNHTISVSPAADDGLANASLVFPAIQGDTDVYVSYAGGVPSAIALSPREFDYGEARVGTTTASRSFTLTNILGGAITVSSVELGGMNPSSFNLGLDTCNGAVLPVLGSCGLQASFTPTTYGLKTARIRINDTGPGSPHTVLLAGSGMDITSPSVSVSSPPDGQKFHLGDVATANYLCNDEPGGSGVSTCTGDLPDGATLDTSEIGDFSFTVHATDIAGNASSKTVHYSVVAADSLAPTISVTSPTNGANIPRGGSLTAQYSCEDEVGGSGLASCSGSSPNGSSLDTSTLGLRQLTITATDNAGNTSSRTISYTVVDVTAPLISVTSPLEGASIPQRQTVTAQFTCADEAGGSGLAACSSTVSNGSIVDTTTLGPHQFTVTATDNAGNQRLQTVHYTVIDVTAPVINAVTPGNGTHYAQGATISANYGCTDEAGGSGLANCIGTVPNGQPIDTAVSGNHTFTINAADNAGNGASKTINYIADDRTAPQVQITSPIGRYTVFGYVFGLPRADFSCTDNLGGSGMASCTATVDGRAIAQGEVVPYLWLGSHVFTVTGVDNAGNRFARSVTYTTSIL